MGRIERLVFVGLLAVAALLDFRQLGVPAMWNDEAFSLFVAADGPGDALRNIAGDTHGPLYYLSLSFWLKLGHSVATLRAFSGLSAVLAAAVTFAAARRVLGPRAALLAMALLVLSPQAVMWAQKARPYGFQSLLVAISLWGAIGVATDRRARTAWIGAGLRRLRPGVDRDWLAYALGAGGAMLAQHPGGFFVLGANAGMLAVLLAGEQEGRGRLLANWCIAQVVAAGLWLLWLPAFMGQVEARLTPAAMQGNANFEADGARVTQLALDLLSVAHLWRAQTAAAVLCALAAAVGLWRFARAGSPAGWMVAATVVVPLAACGLGYALLHPVFGYVLITFNWMLVPYSILLAAGFTALRPWPMAAGAAGLLLLLDAWGVRNYDEERPPGLDAAGAAIAAEMRDGDAVLFDRLQSGRFAVAFYVGAAKLGDPRRGDMALPGMDASMAGRRLISDPAEVARYRRIWVVRTSDEPDRVALAADPAWRVVREARFGGNVRVVLVARAE